MLVGSLIGDAAGGPVEFAPPEKVRDWLPGSREWGEDRILTASEIGRLADSFRLLPYDPLRPVPAPYAHWTHAAAAGTVTDDSRHKFMLLAALRRGQRTGTFPIQPADLAAEYLGYLESAAVQRHPTYRPLCEEWLREYNQAARWIRGDRDPDTAAPAERLWGGVSTNAGQMALLPLAAAHAGEPESAYRAAFQLGYIDNGTAKDINSAIVAGLAAAINLPPEMAVATRWAQVRRAMCEVDPYRYGQIPWVQRPIARWLDFADTAVRRARRSPRQLFQILERDGEPRFHWDAHFVIASSWAFLSACDFNGLAALQLSLDFGHDTDSAAQLVGALSGAVEGEEVFPKPMSATVVSRLQSDYLESVDEWTDLLIDLQDRERYPRLVG